MMKSHTEQVAFITGASAGIGLELTRKLLAEDWQVVALNRSNFPEEDKSIQNAIHKGTLRVYKTKDLSDYDSLRSTLEEIKSKEQKIDILFNNAGGSFSQLSYSKQGRELHYELLTVVPYIILLEMKELLEMGELKTVINTSSTAFNFTRAFSMDILEHPKTFRKLTGPYATSKLALSLWTQAIASQLAEKGIRIRSVDPGGNNTLRKGKPSGIPLVVKAMMQLFFPPPAHGANELYEGALGPHRSKSGVYLVKGQVTKLKFSEQAQTVLEGIHMIYEHEYMKRPTAASHRLKELK